MSLCNMRHMCRGVAKGTLSWKNLYPVEIEFGIACY